MHDSCLFQYDRASITSSAIYTVLHVHGCNVRRASESNHSYRCMNTSFMWGRHKYLQIPMYACTGATGSCINMNSSQTGLTNTAPRSAGWGADYIRPPCYPYHGDWQCPLKHAYEQRTGSDLGDHPRKIKLCMITCNQLFRVIEILQMLRMCALCGVECENEILIMFMYWTMGDTH